MKWSGWRNSAEKMSLNSPLLQKNLSNRPPHFTTEKWRVTKISMLEEILQLDRNVFLYLNGLGNDTWDGFWLTITNKWSSLPVYLAFLILSYKYYGLRKTLLVLIAVTLMITCTDQLANMFKYGVQRLRPCYEEDFFGVMRLVKASCGGKYAFFSAHAANSFALASFFVALMRRHLKYIGFFIIFWAMLVSYSRIYIGVHYPADILTGALIGLLFGWLFSKLYIFAVHKFAI